MSSDVRGATLATAMGLAAIAALYVQATVSPALATGVFGVLIVIASWQPVVMLGLIAALLPLFHQPFHVREASLAPSEIILAATCVGTLVRLTGAGPSGAGPVGVGDRLRAGTSRLKTPFGVVTAAALCALTIAGAASLAGVDDAAARAAGLRELRWTLVEPLVLVGLLAWHTTTPRERAFIGGAFVSGGLAVAIWGLADALSGSGVSAGGVTRASGPFPHPNAYALYLLRPVALAAAYLVLRRSRALPSWLIWGVGGAALVASFSRSAALGLIVGGLILWPWLSARLRVVTATGAAATGALLLLLAGDRAVGGSGQDSLALRGDIWRSGSAMIRDRPLLGYGPDQFLYVYSPRYVDPAAWAERFTSHGHNLIIDAWVRVGIIGAVWVLLALALIARAGRAVAAGHKVRPDDVLSGAAVVALAAALAQGLVDNGYFVHDLAMSAWLLGWIAFATPGRDHRRGALQVEDSRNRGSRTGRIPSL